MTPSINYIRFGKRYLLLLFALVLIIITPVSSPAQNTESADMETPAEEFDPVVVTARGTPGTASKTPGGVGVITADEIDRAGPAGLTDIIRMIPGVEKTSDSPWGSDINIRGFSRNSVLFLIDGCRVNTATDINARFGLLNPNDIERIEVLKGPISALYGWGGMGGVVNVITRTGGYARDPRTHGELSAETSSNPRGYGTYAMGTYSDENIWVLASGGYRDYDDRKSADETVLHNSQYRDKYGRFGSGYKWNEKNETTVNIQVMEGENIGIPGKGLALAVGPDVTYPSTRRIMGAVTHIFSPESGILKNSLIRAFFQKVDRNVRLDEFPSAAPLESAEPGADHTTIGLNWTNRFSIGSHVPVVGVELWKWEIDNTERIKTFKTGLVGIDSSLGNVSQTVGGVFAEDNAPISDTLKLSFGGRLDAARVKSDDLYNWISPPSPAVSVTRVREGDTEEEISYQGHIGLTWQFAPKWSATALAAAGYRPPDLMDLFKYVSLGGGVGLYGNPDLDPEKSRFFETGIHMVDEKFRISGAFYYNHLTDMITENQVSSTRIEMENVDKARIYGSEISGEWKFFQGFQLSACLAWTRGDNRTTDEALPFIAPLNTRVALMWEPESKNALKGWRAEIIHEWADAQDRVPEDTDASESWQTVDIYAGYSFHACNLDHELTAGVTNLFDEDYKNFLSTSRGMELKEAGIGFSFSYRFQF